MIRSREIPGTPTRGKRFTGTPAGRRTLRLGNFFSAKRSAEVSSFFVPHPQNRHPGRAGFVASILEKAGNPNNESGLSRRGPLAEHQRQLPFPAQMRLRFLQMFRFGRDAVLPERLHHFPDAPIQKHRDIHQRPSAPIQVGDAPFRAESPFFCPVFLFFILQRITPLSKHAPVKGPAAKRRIPFFLGKTA